VAEAARAHGVRDKAGRQIAKDLHRLPGLVRTVGRGRAAGTLAADVVRNFCCRQSVSAGTSRAGGTFSEEQFANEVAGRGYVRQLWGRATRGTVLFHFMTGHMSFQIEATILFPAVPSNRYGRSHRVREVCERHGLPTAADGSVASTSPAVKKNRALAFP